ncbi:adenylyl cyclase [mine drainage metagenome]|uniref:Adenylyl cyclase n=1 Tax=mine drainage metagenome TaxID=410659 RepID=T0Y939_9ZZZZ
MFSFLKIIAKINKLSHIVEYSRNKKLQEKLPGYKVKMGFGLHFGWAIEGAIGSEFKIDASYLSPNVNIASRLEAATK